MRIILLFFWLKRWQCSKAKDRYSSAAWKPAVSQLRPAALQPPQPAPQSPFCPDHHPEGHSLASILFNSQEQELWGVYCTEETGLLQAHVAP